VRGLRGIAAGFVVSIAASVALMVLYALGGQAQLEGVLLALALGGLGTGIVLWATDLLDEPDLVEEREPLPSAPEERREASEALGAGAVTRRAMLVRLVGGAVGALAAALAIPSLSLGPRPGEDLFRTGWTRGARVVGDGGEPIAAADVEPGSVATVFPEGRAGSADSQALLMRVDEASLRLPAERAGWTPGGCVAYSKVCTHAGCPVGLYRAEAQQLLCPCHQSTFDVLRGAVPVFGPAARALPQLPLGVDAEGLLVAGGDFSEPVGPSFWNLTSGEGSG
jgi:ubiquinol-cytochrome c reductase iron-sulfur subunit